MRLLRLHKNYASIPPPAKQAALHKTRQRSCYRRKCKQCKHIHAALDCVPNFWETADPLGGGVLKIPAFKSCLEGASKWK